MKRKRLLDRDRYQVYIKYGGRCAYCGQPITYKEMQVEHREPLSLGGADSPENYMPSCRTCNHYKHTLTVEEFRKQIGLLTGRLRERVYIYKLALRHGRISERSSAVSFYFERVPEYADIEEHQTAEQHQQLKTLHETLDGVLGHEPADSGSEAEDDIWALANSLKEALDDFFEEVTHDN